MNATAKARAAMQLPPRKLLGEIAWRGARGGIGLYERARMGLAGSTPRALGPQLSEMKLTDPGAARDVPERAVETAVEEAEEALKGRFRILGFGYLDFGRPPNWSLDPVSGHVWPTVPHRRLPSEGARAGADVKIPWEASRVQWLTALARAHAYTGDARYKDGAGELVQAWRRANPAGRGVAWSNAMEAGIRAAGIVWSSQIFRDDTFDRLVSPMLVEHGRFIVENLEYSPRLTSNHFLADVVGLVHVGAALRSTRRGRLWLRLGWRALQREIVKQFRPDGFNFESSTCYHRLSTELALSGLMTGRAVGLPIGPEVRQRMARALCAAVAVTKPDGYLAAVGDDDSGLVVNLASARSARDVAPLLSGPGFPEAPASDVAREFRAWIAAELDLPSQPVPSHLVDSGVCVLSDDRFWCLVDAGPVGQNGNGGHAHNDTLSFVLAVDGEEIVTDPGSATYTADPARRNWYRSTAAHSTLEIDGEEINRFSGDELFRMKEDAHPRVEEFTQRPEGSVLSASHDGYKRLADPVHHRRRFDLDERGLTIREEIACAGAHRGLLSLPLAAGTSAERIGEAWSLSKGSARVGWEVLEGPPASFEVRDARVSPAYGAEDKASVVRSAFDFSGPTTLVHRFSLEGPRP